MTSTNPPAASPAPPPSPAQRALMQLDELETGETTWTSPAGRSLYAFGGDRVIDESSVDERVEQARVRVLIQDAERKAREQRADESERILLDALETLRFDSTRFAVLSRLGALHFRAQRIEEAIDYLRKALAIQPDDYSMASNLAAAQMTLGHLDDALETLRSIRVGLITSPQLLFSVHFNLACLHSLKGNNDEALRSLYRAAEVDPASTFASLGDTQLDGIRSELAFRELQTGLEGLLGPR